MGEMCCSAQVSLPNIPVLFVLNVLEGIVWCFGKYVGRLSGKNQYVSNGSPINMKLEPAA